MNLVEHSAAVPAEPDTALSDPDAALAGRFKSAPVRYLALLAVGLSAESMELLVSVTDRLRAAEGALRDPLTADLD